jgi:hypothetical protein
MVQNIPTSSAQEQMRHWHLVAAIRCTHECMKGSVRGVNPLKKAVVSLISSEKDSEGSFGETGGQQKSNK